MSAPASHTSSKDSSAFTLPPSSCRTWGSAASNAAAFQSTTAWRQQTLPCLWPHVQSCSSLQPQLQQLPISLLQGWFWGHECPGFVGAGFEELWASGRKAEWEQAEAAPAQGATLHVLLRLQPPGLRGQLQLHSCLFIRRRAEHFHQHKITASAGVSP